MSLLLLGGTKVVAGGSLVQPFFEDYFAGGVTNPANGFTYSNELGGLDNTTVVAAGGSNEVDAGYTHSLRTTFPSSVRPGQTGNRQINFSLGRECDEFWLEWRVHIPSNYAHRNNYDPGPPYGAVTDNNKFITLYADTYSAGWHQPMCELETDGTIGANESDNKSYVKAMMRYSTDTTRDFELVAAGTLTTIEGDNQLLIGSGAPLTPGSWHTVRFHTRKESVQGARDGVWRLWVNGTLVTSLTGLAMGASNGAKFSRGVEKGYLLGYANSGFTNATTFHTQWIKCYDTNPGW